MRFFSLYRQLTVYIFNIYLKSVQKADIIVYIHIIGVMFAMDFSNIGKIVFKVGTSTLTHDNGKPDYQKFESLARILSDLHNSGKEIVLVSSGAISVGMDSMRMDARPSSTSAKQALAAVGQSELMFIYDKFFSEYNKVIAQVLMTKDAVLMRDRRQNIINTFNELFGFGVIPIVNENDTVAIDELVFGDNDTLSAMVAECVGADLLVIITDVEGLYNKNPAENEDAELISEVSEITTDLFEIAGGSGSNRGTGGMYTKLQAAQIAAKAGVATAIISGRDLHNIYRLANGEKVGTVFTV